MSWKKHRFYDHEATVYSIRVHRFQITRHDNVTSQASGQASPWPLCICVCIRTYRGVRETINIVPGRGVGQYYTVVPNIVPWFSSMQGEVTETASWSKMSNTAYTVHWTSTMNTQIKGYVCPWWLGMWHTGSEMHVHSNHWRCADPPILVTSSLNIEINSKRTSISKRSTHQWRNKCPVTGM